MDNYKKNKKLLLFYHSLLMSVIINLDQWSKFLIIEYSNKSFQIFLFLKIIKVWNRGISFGIMHNIAYANIIFISLIMIIICFLLKITLDALKNGSIKESICLNFIIAGAIGNLIDRIRYGAVFDFIDFHIFDYHWPAFNIADSFIVIGSILLMFFNIFKKKSLI
ncbi:MAG: signal peptidase II [Anaplasmataceae bacterium]|nr:signal peptidase II [Anaplasmataceae bacterium]